MAGLSRSARPVTEIAEKVLNSGVQRALESVYGGNRDSVITYTLRVFSSTLEPIFLTAFKPSYWTKGWLCSLVVMAAVCPSINQID